MAQPSPARNPHNLPPAEHFESETLSDASFWADPRLDEYTFDYIPPLLKEGTFDKNGSQ
jgi:hypothetical protein